MKKRKPKSEKDKTWNVFSEFIRRRDALKHSGDADGICRCVTCGVLKHWKEMQAGHGMAGRKNSILFEEKLTFAQCPACNVFGGGKYDEFHDFLLREYGQEGWDNLFAQKHTTRKWSAGELSDMRKNYQDRINAMLNPAQRARKGGL